MSGGTYLNSKAASAIWKTSSRDLTFPISLKDLTKVNNESRFQTLEDNANLTEIYDKAMKGKRSLFKVVFQQQADIVVHYMKFD